VGKTADQATEAARKDIAAVIRRFTDIAHTAVANLTEEDIQQGFALPAGDAPKWTNMVERVVGAAARAEAAAPTQINNSLSLVMVGKAESTDKWLEAVQAVQRKKPKMLDAQVIEKERKK
jgi:hypothetical protein